jgi:DNA-binding response OmpR family regulator
VSARILCVDDEDDICQLLETILTMCGYTAVVATTGAEALARARTHPDLVILDVNLPDLDGIEVCRRLRQIDRTVPVLFITAATGARRREAIAAGGSAFLEKPFDVDELLDMIERLLSRRHERRTGRDRRQRLDGYRGPERRQTERRSTWQMGRAASNASVYERRGSPGGQGPGHAYARAEGAPQLEPEPRPPAMEMRGRREQ